MTKLVNRAKMTTATTGTGTITLGSAVDGYQTFAAAGVADADVVRYVIEDGDAWEIGLGTYTASGTTLTRGSIESSNSDLALNLTGNAVVFVSAAAADLQELVDFADNFVLPTTDGSTGQVLTTNGAGTLSFTTVGGGGLTQFTEARSTATPNATIPVHSIAATGAETNIDVAIVPKGDGAFSLQVADNTTAGGDKRGRNAVDLQTARALSQNVASGQYSAVLSGVNNRATAFGAVVVGGGAASSINGNIASGQGAFVGGGGAGTGRNTASGAGSVVCGGAGAGGGSDNTASGAYSFIGSGWGHTASGANSVVTGGTNNTANAQNSTVVGGGRATTNSILGLMAYGFNGTTLGRNQMSFFGARTETTDATPKRATANDAAAATTNQLTLRNNSAFAFEGKVVARDISTGDMKSWQFKGAIKRGASAGSTAIVGSPSIDTIAEDTAASTWEIAISADTTNGALAVTVTGQAAKTVRWTTVIHSAEVA